MFIVSYETNETKVYVYICYLTKIIVKLITNEKINIKFRVFFFFT